VIHERPPTVSLAYDRFVLSPFRAFVMKVEGSGIAG
jgi:hypothetical protein